MRPASDLALRILVYALLAVGVTWPLVTDPAGLVVGGPRSDVWNSLWGLWFVAEQGPLPQHTGLLDHPAGGRIAVADPLGAVLGLPLTRAVGPVAAYAASVLLNLVLGGVLADRLARTLGGTGWLAGVGWMLAPLTLSHLQNGSSEAIGIGWLPLACLAVLQAVQTGRWAWRLGAGAALWVCAMSGWYAGVGAWIFVSGVLVVGWGEAPFRERAARLLPGAALALAATLPWAAHVRATALAADGLVDIKQAADLARIRRTLGAADPRIFLLPGDFRSPDFASLEGNPSDYVHTAYLGLVTLGLSIWATVRRGALGLRGRTGAWWWTIALALTLSLGPVLVWDGRPLALGGRGVGLPLPYLALEALPGFGSLSLLYRLAGVAVLGLCVLADRATTARSWPAWAGMLAAEVLLLSPARSLPDVTPVPSGAPFAALRADADGAVLDLPPTASRDYLYEQVLHGHPRVGSLNQGINLAGLQLGRVARAVRAEEAPPEALTEMAREQGIRWVVQHRNQLMEEEWIKAASALRAHGTVVAEDERVRVIQLY